MHWKLYPFPFLQLKSLDARDPSLSFTHSSATYSVTAFSQHGPRLSHRLSRGRLQGPWPVCQVTCLPGPGIPTADK